MSDDGFFGRPTATTTTTVAPRASRPPQQRRAPAGSGPKSRDRQPAPARNRTPQHRPTPPRPPRAPRPARVAPAPLTGSQLRTRTLRRLLAFVVVMGLLVGYIGVRLVNIQVVSTDRTVAYGESQRDGGRTLPASRGAIYDRNGEAFALSVAQPRAIADPAQVDHPTAVSNALAEVLDVDAGELRTKLVADSRYRILDKDLSEAEVEGIKAGIEDGTLEGISLEDDYVRANPNDTLARGVIGTALPEGQTDELGNTGGISGLEAEYDSVLAGHPGTMYYEQDVWGDPIAGGERTVEPAKQGTDVYLTIDQVLQYEAERSMAQVVEDTGASSGMAVIMRPSTGEVLAMANVADDGEGNVVNTRDNRAVTAVFEPGSTNKMITISGALEEGLVDPDTLLEVPDNLQIYDREFTDSHPHPPTTWSVTDILATSSNIGTIKIAQKLGKTKVDAYLRAFGFGETTGLGFPAEEDGIMRDLADWSGVDIGSIPIGQGISVTALQMLAAYNVVANDGVYVAPRLLAGTDEGSGQVATEPSSQRRVISEDTAQAMRAMLGQVVKNGTGERAAVPGYDVVGKTGTAWIAQTGGSDEDDGYFDANGNRRYQASFVGMVSGADLSIIVTVEDPRTEVYGSDVAAPVFAHLAATSLRRYHVPPPALLSEASQPVPELSDSAKDIDGTGVVGGTSTPAG